MRTLLNLKPKKVDRSSIGLCIPALHEMSIEKPGGDFKTLESAVRALSPGWVRVYISWPEIETMPGRYEWELYNRRLEAVFRTGAKVLATIARAPAWCAHSPGEPIFPDHLMDYEKFIWALTVRYGKSIHAWEITNEPDNTAPDAWRFGAECYGYHPHEYIDLLERAYRVIKKNFPSTAVILGGLAHDHFLEDGKGSFRREFLTEIINLGVERFIDALNFHYYYDSAPYWEKKVGRKVQDIGAKILALRMQFGFHKPIWITETGYPSSNQRKQAQYLMSVTANALSAGAAKVFWFALTVPLENNGMGLLTPEWKKKMSFDVFREM